MRPCSHLRRRIQAERALASDEVPVGCVFVHRDDIIGEGMNDTNRSLNVRSSFAGVSPETYGFGGNETCRVHWDQ